MRHVLLALAALLGGAGCGAPTLIGEAPPANIEVKRSTTDAIGVVIGLRGRGDGPAFLPLVQLLNGQPELRGIDPRDAALVTVSRSAVDANGRVWLWIWPIGPCDNLQGGYLTTTAMFKDFTMDEVYYVSGPVRVDPTDGVSGGTSRSLLLTKAQK
jgi:hypothetical protein